MAGRDDAVRLQGRGPLAAADVRSIMGTIAPIVDARAAGGTPHGRISPDALRLAADGTAQLIDVAEADASADYTAPEVRDGGVRTVRSEVFSLASTTYSLLTGHPPNPYGFATVRRDRPDLGPEVDGVLLQATARTPDIRFASAVDFAAALAEALAATEPAAAASTSPATAPIPTIRPLVETASPAAKQSPATARQGFALPEAALPLVFLGLVVLLAIGFIVLFFNGG